MKHLIISIISVMLFSGIAYANGFGQTLDKPAGDYIVNVDYDSFAAEIDAQIPVRFNFQLWTKDRTELASFSNAWVRIAPQDASGILFAGTLGQPAFGPAGFSYVFPKGGAYGLTVRFEKNGKELHDDVSFPLTVVGEGGDRAQGASGNWQTISYSGIAGIIIGFALAFLSKKKAI